MTTTTNFNIGDEAFSLHRNRVETGKVIIIEIKVQAGAHQVVNTVDFRSGGMPLKIEDELLFHSKRELLDAEIAEWLHRKECSQLSATPSVRARMEARAK